MRHLKIGEIYPLNNGCKFQPLKMLTTSHTMRKDGPELDRFKGYVLSPTIFVHPITNKSVFYTQRAIKGLFYLINGSAGFRERHQVPEPTERGYDVDWDAYEKQQKGE